jgi:3-methyladenine DNA glycosylase/8-oxoguanine DNA glycosylase
MVRGYVPASGARAARRAPSEDVGVRNAVQRAYGLPAPPTPAEVDLLGEKWRPHRSLVAAYLFASLAHATEPTPAEQKPDSPTF